jgi:hypothetical protein
MASCYDPATGPDSTGKEQAPTLTRIEVSPTSATLSAGGTQQFMALGRMSDGSAASVTVSWTATGGTISQAGLYTAGSTAGSFQVIAVRQGDTEAGTSTVTVVPAAPTLSAIEITPATASLSVGGTQQFSAVGRMSDGSTSSVNVTWSSTGGTMSSSGLYTAGSVAGSFSVTGQQQGGTKAGTSSITITAAPTPPVGVTLPELPRVQLNTDYVAPSGARVDVAAGGNLQSALNGAACGSEIVLAAGATFTGNFVLPAKGCGAGNRIYLRSGGTLPAAGQRMTPGQASGLAKLRTSNGDSALRAASGASGYRIIGLDLGVTAGSFTNYGVVSLGNGESSAGQLPTDIIFDRVYIHGNTGQNVRRGIALNSGATAIVDSYISEIHENGADSQALGGWDGVGPYKIVNNYLEAAGENVMFGGSDTNILNGIPSDIEIRRNHFFKPLAWRSQNWVVKNLLELKKAQRVLIEGNVFDNHWPAAQNGFAVVMMSNNQDGHDTWAVVQDVTWRYNVLENISAGFNIAAANTEGGSSVALRRILIYHNLLVRLGETGTGRFIQVNGTEYGTQDVTVEHNTAVFSTASGTTKSSALMLVGTKGTSFTYRNNVVENGEYSIMRDGGLFGTAALNASFSSWIVQRNVVVGGQASDWAPDNYYPASLSAVGFVSPGSNWALSATSAYRQVATDGTDPGYDRATTETTIQGVVIP